MVQFSVKTLSKGCCNESDIVFQHSLLSVSLIFLLVNIFLTSRNIALLSGERRSIFIVQSILHIRHCWPLSYDHTGASLDTHCWSIYTEQCLWNVNQKTSVLSKYIILKFSHLSFLLIFSLKIVVLRKLTLSIAQNCHEQDPCFHFTKLFYWQILLFTLNSFSTF